MIKNDLKVNMLFLLLAISVAACSVNNRAGQSKSDKTARKSTNHVRKGVDKFARKQLGVKYKYAGKNPKGFDCSGFTSYVLKEFNVALSGSSRMQAKQGRTVNIKWAQKGDLLFFGSGSKISHVAIILENNRDGIRVIHATSSRGVVIDNVSNSKYWQKRLLFARNVIGD